MDLEKLTLPLDVADKAFNVGIAGAIAGTTALIGAMGMAVKATFNWAAELDSIQDRIGGTATQAAALNFTLRKSGVDTAKFTSGLTIMSKGLVKADGSLDTVGKELKDFGINVLDANGGVKDQNQLIGEISDKYNTFATQQERVNFLTATFGRSGAELIDFFDTLAAEGGIDAVTSKVERLGLVIDPARYEQFTRSLEELKLVGLGLAVGFTEKVMPAFEGFLNTITGPGTFTQKATAILSSIDHIVGTVVEGFATSIDNWIADGGPEELSKKLISWIEGIGEGDQSEILTAAGHLVTALATAISQVEWGEIATAINVKLTEIFDNMDWSGSGASFGAGIETLFVAGIDSAKEGEAIPTSLQSLLTGINDFFMAAVGADQFGGWNAYFIEWNRQRDEGIKQAGEEFKASLAVFWQNIWTTASQKITEFWSKWKTAWLVKVHEWGVAIYNAVIEQVNKIISAFNSIPLLGDVSLLASASTGASAGRTASGRASGGPVIAGQSYNVAEFYKPERFTPSSNGRIDPIGGDDNMMSMMEIIVQRMADEIARSNRTMFEKVGRR